MARVPAMSGASSFVRVAVFGVACCTALALTAPLTVEPADAAVRKARKVTAVNINARSNLGAVKQGVLGVNHRFVGSGHGMWDVAVDRPDPVAVRRLRQAGVGPVRYPGGIVGNLFDWKHAIGPDKGCQTTGRLTPNGYPRTKGVAYGVDEHMEFVDAINGSAVMMVPFATETPSDAADWVEYMNSPADGPEGSNPNGGVDWANVRELNGHPGRYNVRLWEIGNEHRVLKQRYWMSQNQGKAMRQYAFGGTRVIRDEALGKNCRHPNVGVRSNGNPGQTFQLLFPPAEPGSVRVSVGANPESWQEVPSLESTGATAQVYEVDEAEGLVRFGDGSDGVVLPRGARVHATYRSTHRGAFAFVKAMKQVDPRINVCVTWGKREFIGIARGRKYDCFSVHAYTHFRAERSRNWRNAVQGHDRHMLGAKSERAFVAGIKRRLPRGKPIALTEFGAIWGNSRVYPQWMASMTHATYMASMWVHWLEMGIPWATGSDMLAPSHRGLLGRAPHFAYSAEALTRQAIRPLFRSGVRRLNVGIARNPARNTRIRGLKYAALMAGATRARNGDLHVLVVNRLPSAGQRVRARVNLARFRSRGVAFVSRVNGASFRSWNGPRVKQVRLTRGRQRIRRNRFTHVFPPHSVTVFRIPSR